MFVFGSPEDTARTFLDNFETFGFGLPDLPLDEQVEVDLKRSITAIVMAVEMALKAGADGETVEVLLSWYEEVFLALAAASKSFRTYVSSPQFFYPGSRTPSRTHHYRSLAISAVSES